MVFSSILFLFRFLPIMLVLYFISPKKFRNFILFIGSLIFYAWGEPVYVVLMLFSTVVDYTHGMLVERFKGQNKDTKAKFVVASSMIINLALLGVFKYADFVVINLNEIFNLGIKPLNLPLPIGISFYTFQTMSYTIDVYRGHAKAQKNIITFGSYVALFPQLIAGPIVQYKTVAEQLEERYESFDRFSYGIERFVTGLGKKVLFANNIGMLWDMISAMTVSELPVATAWLGALAFTFQIYFDFSGYSDMAIGLGHMFGFKFLENFEHPYESRSITEFWRRWHISLGTWFREYVYIPLGGNRCGKLKQIRNIIVVWALTGIWHGASWNFLVWGLYFCTFLVLEKLFLLKWLEKAPKFVGHIYTMFLVVISWVIFAFDDMQSGANYIKAMFGGYGAGLYDEKSVYLLLTNLVIIVVLAIASTTLPLKLAKAFVAKLENKQVLVTVIKNVFLVAVFLLVMAYLVNSTYNPFLYFRF